MPWRPCCRPYVQSLPAVRLNGLDKEKGAPAARVHRCTQPHARHARAQEMPVKRATFRGRLAPEQAEKAAVAVPPARFLAR